MPKPPATAWHIRIAEETDADRLAAMPPEAGVSGRSSADWRAWLGEPATLTLIAEAADGRLSGLIDVRQAADEAEIIDLWVAPPDRRLGVAGALLARLRTALAACGAQRLFLEVAVDNAAACALYEKQGFATIAHRNAYYARPGEDPVDARVMVCPIGHH